MPNYYELLGCRRDATLEELKKSYRESAKKFHPDKSSGETCEDFQVIKTAWETLRDPSKRREYDRELARREFDGMPLYSEVELREMTEESDGSTYTYDCRCGGVYSLDKSDVAEADEIRVGCDDCTFYIRVKVSGEKT